jgi:drug/metabolite transporter (DMT)-like permease
MPTDTAAPTTTKTADNTSLAIILMLAAMLFFAVMDGIAKHVTQTLAIPQVLWFRNIVLVLISLAILKWQQPNVHPKALITSARPGLQLTRGLLLVIESAVFMLAFRMMPLADVHALAASAPLLVVALSAVFLGEHVGPRRWAAVAVGFIGVLFIVRPGFATIGPPMLIALTGAVLWALYQVLVRLASRVDSAATSSLWTAFVGLGATSVIGPLNWVWPDPQTWALLIIIAILGSLAHVTVISAIGMADASTLQPFGYTLFIWAIVVGYLMFGHIPDRWTLLGAAIIIASGLYVWHRERVRAREAQNVQSHS